MQSHQDAFGAETSKRYGHRRTPSMGKAMPVTSLLLDFPPPTRSSLRSSCMRDGRSPDQERPPLYFALDEPTTTVTTVATSIAAETADPEDDLPSEDELNLEQAYELLVSECSSADDDEDQAPRRNSDEQISLIGNSIFYTPCLTCTDSAPADLGTRVSAINEMCRRLCTDECRLRLSLAGFEPPSALTLQSKEALAEYVKESLSRPQLQHTCSEDTLNADDVLSLSAVGESKAMTAQKETKCLPDLLPPRPPSHIAIQRKQFLTGLLSHNADADTDSESEEANDPQLLQLIADLVVPRGASAEIEDAAGAHADRAADKKAILVAVDPHEIAMLKDSREKFEIAEALAKTSAMTSTPRMKQRLAARKLEIDNANANANASATANAPVEKDGRAVRQKQRQRRGAANSPGHDALKHRSDTDIHVDNYSDDSGDDDDADADKNIKFASDAGAVAGVADTVATAQHNLNDFEPPRDLLLYLVRMGSFNSAPKINNVDSQDDSLEIPKGLSSNELLQHVKHLRGEHQPSLLSRYFVKPSLAAQMVSNDITDGLRSLKLNSVARDYSAAPTSPNQIRVLQWNILSQTLGQNNDGFVRCPEEALTWDNRKFLIVEEILQNNPDLVCLQEVDHFKFLQNILGTQNYEGFFFPKPDSPCLYIEENNGPDGCAIFFKRDKYELKSFDKRILEVWRVQSNQVAIVANLAVKATGKEFCVCTTHLKARHGSLLSKLRNEQGRDMLRFVKQFAGSRPVLVCGDFNAEPTEPVYSTILNCDLLKLSSAYADIKFERDECNNDSDRATDGADDKVQRSIEREPPYTTWKIREDGEECHTIDYVFYSQEHFKVRNCLGFPHGDEIGKNRTPSFQYPSDHFSLVCDFEFVEQQ